MSPQSPQHLRDYVRRLCADAAAPSDPLLWERFVRSNDQDAFELLVRRHGPMVLACARRVLADGTEAEDVFQATFLTLARARRHIRDPRSLTSWLYRTAYRHACKLRSRRRPVGALNAETVAAPATDLEWREVRAILDEELRALPDKLRSPLLLCYLGGLTRDEAARQLGCSFDQLKRRLEDGRNSLRNRLEHRGVTGAGLALAVLTPELLRATVSLSSVESCLRVVFERGATVPPVVASLCVPSNLFRGLLMKTMIASVLCVSIGAWGYSTIGSSREPQEKPVAPTRPVDPLADPKSPEPKTAELPEARRADAAQRQRSLRNLRKILLAVHNFEATHTYLPGDTFDKAGKPRLSWRVALLPFLDKEGADLYKQFKLNEPWDSEHNFKLLAKMPDVYRVGIEPKDSSHTYYQVFAGPRTPLHPGRAPGAPANSGAGAGGSAPGGEGAGGVPPVGGAGTPPPSKAPAIPEPADEFPARLRLTSITDGTSNTIGVVEACPPVPWTKPADLPFDPKKPVPPMTGPFANALHVAMMDGSCMAMRRNLDDETMMKLIVMDDGLVIPAKVKLHAALPPETDADRQALQKVIDLNRKLLDRHAELFRENIRLLDLLNKAVGDFDEAEEMGEQLNHALEAFVAENKTLRDELEAKTKRVTPKPAESPKK